VGTAPTRRRILGAFAAAVAAACVGASGSSPRSRQIASTERDDLILREFLNVSDGVPGLRFLRIVSATINSND
jgi:hypothetical protein